MRTEMYGLRPWVVMLCSADGNKELARYRYRGDAEGHAQSLRRLVKGFAVTVMFDQNRFSLR